MALVIPESYAQVWIGLKLNTDPEVMYVTLGIRDIGGGDAAGMQVALDFTLDTFLLDVIGTAANLGNAWTFVGGFCKANTTDMGMVVLEDPRSVAGTAGSIAAVPPNCALLVHKRSALGGRQHRGRWYLPNAFTSEAAIDDAGNVAGATVTAVNGRLQDFIDDMVAGATLPVILHNEVEAPGVTPEPDEIVSLTCSPKIASQRRRLRP